MTTQLTIADALAAEGIARATAASTPEALDAVDRLIARFAATGDVFSANDVRPHLPTGIHPNAIGGRFRRAAGRGLIRHVDWEASSDPRTHGHHIKLWQGVS
ncbi:hypothetical protein [Nocardiopsis tropica]|uniref:Uncharacterized protein n=1 Tax=Nocardiopsis tropica TaxID=109330 RepID=A0ABU7KR31_9ACTN|nr:hypothetical protein [Nocardiopsis umidischolae]MEE2051739.1 hypothetical protein [Nocardiopsis umidischolae]